MKYKVYYENSTGSIGGYTIVGFFKLCCWILMCRIQPANDNVCQYFIRKIETSKGTRV